MDIVKRKRKVAERIAKEREVKERSSQFQPNGQTKKKTITDYIKEIGKGAIKEAETIAENIGIGVSKIAKEINPSNPIAITSSVKEQKEYKPKTIAEYIGKVAVDIAPYFIPSTPARLGAVALTSYGEHSGDLIDTARDTAYAIIPSPTPSRIKNALKGLAQGVIIESATAGAKAFAGNKPEDGRIGTPIFDIIANAVSGYLTKGKLPELKDVPQSQVKEALKELAKKETKAISKSTTNQKLVKQILSDALDYADKLKGDKDKLSNKEAEEIRRLFANDFQKAYIDRIAELVDITKKNFHKNPIAIDTTKEIISNELDPSLFKLYAHLTKNRNDQQALSLALEKYLKGEDVKPIPKGEVLINKEGIPPTELHLKRAVLGHKPSNKESSLIDLLFDIKNKEKRKSFYEEFTENFRDLGKDYKQQLFDMQQKIYDISTPSPFTEHDLMNIVAKHDGSKLPEDILQVGDKVVGIKLNDDIVVNNPSLIAPYLINKTSGGKITFASTSDTPERDIVNVLKLYANKPFKVEREVIQKPHTKKKAWVYYNIYYSNPFLDPKVVGKAFKGVVDIFKPDYSAELRREIANELLNSGELAFRPLALLKGLSERLNIPYDDIIYLHKLNEGNLSKTIEDVIKHVDDADFWKTIKQMEIPDKDYAEAIDTLVKKHKLHDFTWHNLSAKEQEFILSQISVIKPNVSELPKSAQRILQELGYDINEIANKRIDEILDHITDEAARIKLVNEIEKYKNKKLRRVVPLYKQIYDTILNYYRTALLTAPSTHLKNIISNTAMTVAMILDDFNYHLLKGNFKEALKSVKGNIKGYNKYLKTLFTNWGKIKVMLNALPDNAKYVEGAASVKNPIFKLLNREDGLFKLAIIHAEANKKGISIEDALQDPEILKKASEYTFTKETKLANVMHHLSKLPFMAFLIPFPRTPSNILVETLKRLFPNPTSANDFAKFITTLEIAGLMYLIYRSFDVDEDTRDIIAKSIEPIGTIANIYEKALEQYANGDINKATYTYLNGIYDVYKTSTPMQLIKTLSELTALEVDKVGGRIAGGFVPSIVRRYAIGKYPYAVKRRSILDYVYSALPNKRGELQQYAKYGQPIRLNVDDPIEALFMPVIKPVLTGRQEYIENLKKQGEKFKLNRNQWRYR